MDRTSDNFQDPSSASNAQMSTAVIPKRKSDSDDDRQEKKRRLPSATLFGHSLSDSDIEFYEDAELMERTIMAKRLGRPASEQMTSVVQATTGSTSKNHSIDLNITKLPDEILQEIFCRLPAIDLVHYCSITCHRFHEVISDAHFIPWKKLYGRYLRGDQEAVDELNNRFQLHSTLSSTGMENLIKFMTTVKKLSPKEEKEAMNRLQSHPQFDAAVEIVENALKITTDGPILGALVAALVIITDDVESLFKLIVTLTSQPAYCKAMYWIEYFYCLSTILLAYAKEQVPDGRRHYQLHYAMYLFENGGTKSFRDIANKIVNRSASATARNEPSLNAFVNRDTRLPTYEQYRIIGYDLQPGDYVRVIAFAGTGKTTTLIEYCKARPNKKFLVIFYNKAAADDARERFPSNTTCRTIHSLAFGAEGQQYKNFGKLAQNVRLNDVERICPSEIIGVGRYVRLGLISKTLENYFNSDREDISTAVVPDKWVAKEKVQGIYVNSEKIIEYGVQLKIAEQAELAWNAMRDLNNRRIKMTHDGYLKLYQLSKPKLLGYDAILVDEAQDCNPATLDIVARQSAPKILVGDTYQQIYIFRGAINALNTIPATKTFYLTQSFRFGPEIAFVANTWMRTVLGEKRKFLIGTTKPSRLDGVIDGQLAIICRTNYAVFKECVAIAERERRPCLSICNGSYDFNLLSLIYYLYLSDKSQENLMAKPKHPYDFLRSYNHAKEFASSSMNREILNALAIVEKYKLQTADRIELVQSCVEEHHPKSADFIVTTAHKSKGLEFKNVRLANDFISEQPFDPDNLRHDMDELNLVYVAMTRAVNGLILSQTVYKRLIRGIGPIFHTPIVGKMGVEAVCTVCSKTEASIKLKYLSHLPLALTYGDHANSVAYLNRPVFCYNCILSTFMLENPEFKYHFIPANSTVPSARIVVDSLSIFEYYMGLLQ